MSEFAFLALGLLLGVTVGSALVVVLRSRAPQREVRLTVTPDSVPRRRSSTLAEDAFGSTTEARGGPADHDDVVEAATDEPRIGQAAPQAGRGSDAVEGGANGTAAGQPASAEPIGSRAESTATGAPFSPVAPISAPLRRQPMVGIAIEPEPDQQLAALRGLAAAAAERAMQRPDEPLTAAALLERASAARAAVRPATATSPDARTGRLTTATRTGPAPAGALSEGPTATATSASGPGSEAATASPGSRPDAPVPTLRSAACDEARHLADERCALAGRSREQAAATHDALREAQRAYDDHQTRGDLAAEAADPRAIRAAKDSAQQGFRAARASASTPDAIEAAAREWLSEINRINHESREAAASAIQEREAANALVSAIERLTLEADAARIAAEAADAACLAAREAVAACEEAEAAQAGGQFAVEPSVPPVPSGAGFPAEETGPGGALLERAERDPAILRMLQGDRGALVEVVEGLAGPSPDETRRWRDVLTSLVDEILARAIEASALNFPDEHLFWGPFTRAQNRDIVAALASLGYRFDGLGGWVDDRIPGQRDLSLAVGYAGLDPMRTRHWPNETEMADLFEEVSVAADEFLVAAAGDLTLGELVTLLGTRADGLADLWNDWGRVRPLLLAG